MVRQDYAVAFFSGPYRSGPWPGLTPSGALVLLGCAAVLALVVDRATSFAALVPFAVATVVVRAPGAASAVAGAYLLPRAVWSLLDPSLPLPPLLLVPAFVFDVAAWLRPSDLRAVRELLPRRPRWRRRERAPRRLTPTRLVLAALSFAVALVLVDPGR